MSAKHHSDSHCRHINARGHRCRSLIAQDHDSLCAHHLAQNHAQAPQTGEAIADELLNGIEDLSTAASVNRYLGNLLKQVSRKRIHRRDAIAQAYICQLLLNSLPALERQHEGEQPEPTEAERHAEFVAQLRANMRSDSYPSPSGSTEPSSNVPTDASAATEWRPETELQPAHSGSR